MLTIPDNGSNSFMLPQKLNLISNNWWMKAWVPFPLSNNTKARQVRNINETGEEQRIVLLSNI